MTPWRGNPRVTFCRLPGGQPLFNERVHLLDDLFRRQLVTTCRHFSANIPDGWGGWDICPTVKALGPFSDRLRIHLRFKDPFDLSRDFPAYLPVALARLKFFLDALLNPQGARFAHRHQPTTSLSVLRHQSRNGSRMTSTLRPEPGVFCCLLAGGPKFRVDYLRLSRYFFLHDDHQGSGRKDRDKPSDGPPANPGRPPDGHEDGPGLVH